MKKEESKFKTKDANTRRLNPATQALLAVTVNDYINFQTLVESTMRENVQQDDAQQSPHQPISACCRTIFQV